MDTPVQPTVATPEPGVASANATEGAAFLTEMMGGMFGATPPPQPAPPARPAMQVPPAQPAMQVPPAQPAMQVPPAQPAPPAQPPTMPLPGTAPVPPPPVDFTGRYGGGQPPADPLATLQEAPALPAETPVAEPQNLNPQQNHAWAAIRAQASQNRRAAEEYRTKYNQLVEATRKYQEEKAAFGQQLNEKDTRIKALEDDIGRIDLTRSTAFREKYDVPIQQAHDKIVQTLQANGMAEHDADALSRQVLSAQRSEVPELLSQLPTYVQGLVMVEAERADGLIASREQAISDWRSTAEGLEAVTQRGNALVNAQHTDKMVSTALDIIRSMPAAQMPPAYQVTDPTFAADRDAQEQKFRAWVQQAPEDQKYAAMLEGFMAPKTYEMLAQTMRENMQLRSILQARGRLAAPPVSGGPAVPPVIQPAAPAPAPTVQRDGFSVAPDANMAQDFARGLMAQFVGQ